MAMEQFAFPPTSKTTLRRKNFKESKLSALLELVGMYKDILEGKKTKCLMLMCQC